MKLNASYFTISRRSARFVAVSAYPFYFPTFPSPRPCQSVFLLCSSYLCFFFSSVRFIVFLLFYSFLHHNIVPPLFSSASVSSECICVFSSLAHFHCHSAICASIKVPTPSKQKPCDQTVRQAASWHFPYQPILLFSTQIQTEFISPFSLSCFEFRIVEFPTSVRHLPSLVTSAFPCNFCPPIPLVSFPFAFHIPSPSPSSVIQSQFPFYFASSCSLFYATVGICL